MERIALRCNSFHSWTPDVSANDLPRCSSARAAASIFPPKGFGTFEYGPCLTMKHRNVACNVNVGATLTLDSRSLFGYEATVIAADAVARARAAREAAVTLVQARADEVASTVALARATAQSANDFTVFRHANSWHGNLPSETYILLLERARLSEMEHHKLFDVLEETMIMHDEWQGMRNKASLDFVHAMQGIREDVAPITPSEEKIPIAARSLRRHERVAKRMRASTKATKAAAVAAASLAAPPSIQGKSKKMPDCARVTNGRIGHKLLTATEEVQLSRKVQDLLVLEAVRSSLQEKLGREPALTEWAAAVDMAVASFSYRLQEGRQSKDRMIQSNIGLVVSVAKKYQGKGLSLEDIVQEVIADETLEHPESIVDRHMFKQDLNKLLETLSEREMDVLRQRFGLDGDKAMTLQALGSKYNITPERVGRIVISAIQKLQQPDCSKVLKEYICDNG